MAWLIRERSWVKGQIDKCERQLDDLPRRLVDLQQQLAALDAVIPRHEVKVDPKAITGTRPHQPALFPYGVVSKSILRRLREANGKPIYTAELAFQLLRDTGTHLKDVHMASVMDAVGRRLRVFASRGLVQAARTGRIQDAVAWSLIQEDEEIETESDSYPQCRVA